MSSPSREVRGIAAAISAIGSAVITAFTPGPLLAATSAATGSSPEATSTVGDGLASCKPRELNQRN